MSEMLKKASDGKLIEAYLELRERRDTAKREFTAAQKPTLDGMKAIENEMLRRLNAAGTDSTKVKGFGTAYITSRKSAALQDRAEFFDFVVENDKWELADIRANAPAVEAFSEENDGALPPGVKFTVEKSVNIRKS